MDNLFFLFRCAQHWQHVRETYNCVQWCAYLVGHIGHEGTLHHTRLVGTFCLAFQLFLFLDEWRYVAHDTISACQMSFAVE